MAERDVDPDLAPAVPSLPAVLSVIAVGGVLGAEARYGLARAIPHSTDQWPWATLLTNVLGCLAIGVLMVFVEAGRTRPLVRPFLGVGILGGFTTFSTFALDAHALSRNGQHLLALSYLVASLVGCLAAVAIGVGLTRRLRRGTS